MKMNLYPKIAFDGIRKNRRLYFPYILTGALMVAMFYIFSFLTESPAIKNMTGGDILMSVLPLGSLVVAVFSVLFLFYTNSFLIKQRYREFGLYSILGMDKLNICRIMLWENLFIAVISTAMGILSGILFSKGAELIVLNLLKADISFDLSIGQKALWQTPLVFLGIYLLLFISSIVRMISLKPLALMQSSKVGEKISKWTWLPAISGIIILSAAYYIAVKIDEPLTALVWFAFAVILVIIATYLLFMAGSVVFCKLLQKNKNYYYKKNHFVSVSSMVYRMKRNGAGLASICILLTMVLVTLSFTASLYAGLDDTLNTRYPNGVNVYITYRNIDGISDGNTEILKNRITPHSGKNNKLIISRSCELPGMFTENGILIDFTNVSIPTVSYDRVGYLYVLSLDEYNAMSGNSKTLENDECLLYTSRIDFLSNTFTVEHGNTYKIKEHLKSFSGNGQLAVFTTPSVYMVVNNIYDFAAPIKDLKNLADEPMMTYIWRCGFDMKTAEAEKNVALNIENDLSELASGDDIALFSSESREAGRDSFYDMYGSLFFLGIMLSTVFMFAAVLIIYYKQICEGYEDKSGFEIMQKVGMTKRDIKKSINSQMLTVFFLPLGFAGIHLAFAFPFISKILLLFAFNNMALSIGICFGCFLIFGIIYAFVYKITSVAYYSIVSGGDNK